MVKENNIVNMFYNYRCIILRSRFGSSFWFVRVIISVVAALMLVLYSPDLVQACSFVECQADPDTCVWDHANQECQFRQGAGASSVLSLVNRSIGLSAGFTTPRGIISILLPPILVIAGLILLFQLISGGFQIMTAVQDPGQADAGKQRITAAVGGFLLLFAAYWIAQILQVVFGITILG